MTHYTHNIDHALNTAIGKEGANPASLQQALARMPAIVSALKPRGEKGGDLAVLWQAEKVDDLAIIERWGQKIRDQYSHLVVLGTGGSSLGAMTLCSLLQPRFMASGLTTHFVDNTDPDTMDQLLAQLPLSNTFFMFVSKSGSTVETMMQAMLVLQAMEAESLPIAEQVLTVTTPGANPLRQLSEQYRIEILEHDPNLGGRFSVLSNVGLLPAAAAGLNVRALREGAKAVQQSVYNDPSNSAPAYGAALQYALLETGKTMTVLMPYCDRLEDFSKWFAQLWGESVGKEGKGTTPIKALGAVDQHSQLQLYQEGPRDKLITFIAVKNAGKGGVVSKEMAAKSGMDYLGGKAIGTVIDAQQRATAQALSEHGVPVRWMEIAQLDEATLGALLQHFMLETMLMAGLMDIDAFNQPGVEASKKIARENLNKAA